MLDQVKSEYPHCTELGCHETHNSKTILIRDMDNGCIQVVDNPDISHFNIINNNQIKVEIFKIDRCLIPSNEHKRCDFAFQTSTHFYFVEIKDTINRTSNHKEKAFEQLMITIQKFVDTFDFQDLNKSAIIAWGWYPKKPAFTSGLQSKKMEMWNKFNMELNEGNSIVV